MTILHPISVASVVFNKHISTPKFFSIQHDLNFVEHWLEWLLKTAYDMSNNNDIDDNDNDEDNIYGEEDYEDSKAKDEKLINIIGFNSARFDWIQMLPYLDNKNWKIVSDKYIGTTTKAKQLIVKHNTYKNSIRFVDLLMYAPGNNLKELVETFSGGEKFDNKGVFPYDILDIEVQADENIELQIQREVNKILENNDTYSKYDFDNSLINSGITVKDYVMYLKDKKNYDTRWKYLEFYNIRDVAIMIKPINNMIKCFKHKMLYKDFDINADYTLDNSDEPDIKVEFK
jgi:hypothetical protein